MDNSIINLPNFPDFTDNNYLIFKDYLKTVNQILHETLFTLEQQDPNVIQNILIARTHIIDKILNTLFEHFLPISIMILHYLLLVVMAEVNYFPILMWIF